MTVTFRRLKHGNAGVMQTVEDMRRLMRRWSPLVRETAERVLHEAGSPQDVETRALAIYNWVQAHMEYVPDRTMELSIGGVPDRMDEELYEPDLLISRIRQHGKAIGDCDDYSDLLGSLLIAAGIRPTIHVTSADPSGTFDHVFLSIEIHGQSIVLDAITNEPMGWCVPFDTITNTAAVQV